MGKIQQVVLRALCLLSLGQGVACSLAQAQPDDADPRPLILPPKQRPSEQDRPLEYWVEQLQHDQYRRREAATRKLTAAGPAAVRPLMAGLQRGDLETVERGLRVLTEIALAQPPEDDGGAWGAIRELAERSSGVRASSASAAEQEIRTHRAKQARKELVAAGIYVGLDDFIISALSTSASVLQIDDDWEGDAVNLQWFRWLEGVEFARVKGAAVRRDVIEALTSVPDLKSITILDATVDEETLRPLVEMRRIDTLEFRYVKLTPELCDLVATMPIRESLSLMGTATPADKVEAMRTLLPGLRIEYKQGGFLGVACQPWQECQITSIEPNSAAEAAGLRPAM